MQAGCECGVGGGNWGRGSGALRANARKRSGRVGKHGDARVGAEEEDEVG